MGVMYEQAIAQAEDIRLHLPRLRWLASIHTRVTEFGVRQGASTIALLEGNPTLTSYDIAPCENEKWIIEAYPSWRFIRGNTLEVEIAPTDFLFIDTLHVYEQLSAELERHSKFVSKTIALHDTYCTVPGPENDSKGMWRAIDEFTARGEWEVVFDEPECNGLTVLGRL